MVPTAWQDEALARDGVSREVPCSALKGETVPDSLPACSEQYCQAKLGTEEAQLQAWSREVGVDSRPGERRLLSTHTPSSTSWLLSSKS